MKINFCYAGRKMALTNERAESSYGIPVLEFDGLAYGPADHLPPGRDELGWLDQLESAATVVAASSIGKTAFARKFFPATATDSHHAAWSHGHDDATSFNPYDHRELYVGAAQDAYIQGWDEGCADADAYQAEQEAT